MRVIAALLRLTRANLVQQLRGFPFALALAAALLGGYLAVPDPGAGYVVFGIGRARGVYNSAWVGGSLALMTAFLLGLLGFFLVRGSLERDRRTGVGRLLAASQVPTGQLLLAKTLANAAVLGLLVCAVALVGPFMQLTAGEAPGLRLVPYLAPFVLITLPVMGAVAAAAVLFDAVRPLRGVAGNILWFFLWAVTSAMARRVSGINPFQWFYGIDPLLTGAADACRAAARLRCSPGWPARCSSPPWRSVWASGAGGRGCSRSPTSSSGTSGRWKGCIPSISRAPAWRDSGLCTRRRGSCWWRPQPWDGAGSARGDRMEKKADHQLR